MAYSLARHRCLELLRTPDTPWRQLYGFVGWFLFLFCLLFFLREWGGGVGAGAGALAVSRPRHQVISFPEQLISDQGHIMARPPAWAKIRRASERASQTWIYNNQRVSEFDTISVLQLSSVKTTRSGCPLTYSYITVTISIPAIIRLRLRYRLGLCADLKLNDCNNLYSWYHLFTFKDVLSGCVLTCSYIIVTISIPAIIRSRFKIFCRSLCWSEAT